MKRLIFSLAIVVVMILTLFVPIFAAGGSQIWYLYNSTIPDKWNNTELYMSMTQGQTGQVDINSGETKMWIANKIAAAQVTYPNDLWVVRLATDSDWGNNANLCAAKVGYWDGTTFTQLGTTLQDGSYYALNFVVELKFVPVGGQTIPANTYLALQITNNDRNVTGSPKTHSIYTGKQLVKDGDWYYSCLVSPQSDPGYPLPELAAGILLGAGLLGFGGFMVVRRKNLAFKS